MLFEKVTIQDAYLIKPERRTDERGFFSRIFCMEEMMGEKINFNIFQINTSFCNNKGTMRGLHYQKSPFEEAKLLRCTHGSVFDVIIDLRPNSPTYLKWFGVELNEDNGWMIFIPKGCAHGFLSLKDKTMVSYMVDTGYQPTAERGIRFDDPYFKIEWPISIDSISLKDRSIPNFKPKT
jgi:dTDP-4-dehydrorhamnose 3,5-epimerase